MISFIMIRVHASSQLHPRLPVLVVLSSFSSFHLVNSDISFCLAAASSALALLDLCASFWLNLILYFFKFFLISLSCSFDSRVGGLGLQTSWQNRSMTALFRIFPWKFQR